MLFSRFLSLLLRRNIRDYILIVISSQQNFGGKTKKFSTEFSTGIVSIKCTIKRYLTDPLSLSGSPAKGSNCPFRYLLIVHYLNCLLLSYKDVGRCGLLPLFGEPASRSFYLLVVRLLLLRLCVRVFFLMLVL